MPDRIRFYLDEMVPKAVAVGLRNRGIDVLTTAEARNQSRDDEDQLAFAAREERVLFTRDSDYAELHSQGRDHAGIVYIPQQRRVGVGAMINSLCLVHDVMRPVEMRGHIEYL